MRILDLGASDRFYSFLLEKRNAKEVVAIDHLALERTGFKTLHEIFNSKVMRCTNNVYNLSKAKYGEFDIVLCLGLLYHLRSPLRALENIREVCRNELYVESHVVDNYFILKDGRIDRLSSISKELLEIPLMQFYPGNELNNDYTNWWGFNTICLKKMLEATNFTVISQKVDHNRAIFKCKVNSNNETLYHRKIESGIVE